MWELTTLLILTASVNVWAGVFPNYHAHFDFIQWDANKKLEDYEAATKWWHTASFYQIYPRSFKDTNADGVGDLKGITGKLSYLRDINITATWLSPIFKSPMADFGYDVANFYEIDPLFGTMQDFEALMKKAKQLGLKIILDFVPNHTSDECEWFKRSAAKDPFFKDFYVWHPGKIIDGVRHPPSNWISVFHGSAWEWHEVRQEYYLHQFVKKQPDLNYRNPLVQSVMKDVLHFWLQKGVDGFRIDAVPHIFEKAADSKGNFLDEPRNNNADDPDDYGYLEHIYTKDQPETIDLVYQWRKVMDDYKEEFGGEDRIILTEAYSPLSVIMQYYGNATTPGAHLPFNFMLISSLNNNSNAYNYADIINTWLSNMPEGRTANWVLGNHDQNRVGSRLGTDRIDMLNMMTMTLPGCSVTYMGEEIGMTDVSISWNDTVDPSACNTNPDIYKRFSRDPERTPFQWNRDYQSGFTTANKTWLPISPDYWNVNMEWETHQPKSHVNIFKELQQNIRKQPALKYGQTNVVAVNQNVLAVERFLLHEYTFITLINIFDNEEKVNLKNVLQDVPEKMVYVLVTSRSKVKNNDVANTSAIILQPKDAFILKSTTKLTTSIGYYTYYQLEDNN